MSNELSLYDDPWVCEMYDLVAGRLIADGDLDLWIGLAEKSGGSVLELACGTGRVLLPLARAGYDITGLDLSPYQLAVAKRKLAAEDEEVRKRVCLLEGDMSAFGVGERFGLIIIPARAFQCLLERADQRRCLEACAAHLRPGGLLAIDVFNPRLSRLTAEGGVEESGEEYPGVDGVTVRETGHTDYDLANQSMVWHSRYECTAAEGAVTVHQCVLPLRYFFRFEMEWMLEACGFEVEALYGNFDRSPFTAESPEMIFVARRKQ